MILEKKEIKELLNQYNDIYKEISEVNSKISKLEKDGEFTDYVMASSKYFPYTKHNKKITAENPIFVREKKKYISILQERACDLLQKQVQLEEFIKSLPTSRLRRIFRYRYFEQYSWKKMAYVIGGNSTADSLRMEHNRFFEEN